ncbi:hypothetical protein PIB30_095453, partial [Stylosanthes scabra]|nr:hypothetical protein [Stylosanthes scabra]
DMTLHLYGYGFMLGYWIWTEHGEIDEVGVNRNRTEPVANMDEQEERVFVANRNQGEHVNWMDNHARYEEMMRDAFGMEVKAIFNTRASKRLSGMMEDVRDRKEHLTQWCRPELKKALYHYWETDEKYLHRQATNKRNRASERCVIYTGGSATPMQTKAKMTKSLYRPMSIAEVFKQTHTLKANKEQFTDKRSSDIWDDFTNNTTVATQQAAESGTNAEALHDELSRRPEVHDAEVEALKEQLREELRLMQEHRRQMGVTGEQMRAGSSSAAQVPPAHPPAPPKDDDADYVDL